MLEIFYNFLGINKQLFFTINYYTNISYIPTFLKYLSNIFFIANFAAIYVVICVYFYYKTHTTANKREYFTPIYYKLVKIGICYALFGCTFAALKFSINLPRPFCSLAFTEFTTIANITNERCLSSFPSAHTGLSLLVTYFLWSYINKYLKTLSCLITIAVAISRITLAMHYPADILYSALTTIIVIFAGNTLYTLLKKKFITPPENWIFLKLF